MSSSRVRRTCVALTGGGTAGHVSAHLALIPELKAQQLHIVYLGCGEPERRLVASHADVEFVTIPAGKLRRHWSWANLTDLVKTVLGIGVSLYWMLKHRPACLLSTGGFVSFPPMVASLICRVPTMTLVVDRSLGLASRICLPWTQHLLCAFAATASELQQRYPRRPCVWTGLPIKRRLLEGSRATGLALCGFDQADELPVICVMGGSQGSTQIATLLARELPQILGYFKVIFLSGTELQRTESILNQAIGERLEPAQRSRIKVFEFVEAELGHLYAASDIALSRGGAYSLFELVYNHIPTLCVPLEAGSRGEQVDNATDMAARGLITMARAAELQESGALLRILRRLYTQADSIKARQEQWRCQPSPSAAVMEAMATYIA